MKIFPHILCRVAGLSFDELEKLNYSEAFCNLLEKESTLKIELEAIKEKILADLKSFDTTFFDFSKIRKFKKLIYKNYTLDLNRNIFQDNIIFNNLLIYNGLLDESIKINEVLETQLLIEDLRIKRALQILSKNPNFLNALPLSSILFAKSLKNYWAKNPKDFRKKELQTEQTIMQYIARMAAKTSPFSSFTKVSSTFQSSITFRSGVKKIKKADTIRKSSTTLQRATLYNNFLLQIFQTLFISNANIFNYLKIRINSTLEKEELEYRFLMNVQNVESFQRVEIQPILELIESYFIEKEQFVILELVKRIAEEVEAEEADLLDFVQELVEIGFVRVDFGLHGNMGNWLEKVRYFVERTPVFDDADVDFFKRLEWQLIDFGNANIWERISILENTHYVIQGFLNKYGFKENLAKILSPEQLIYEDVATTEMPNFEAEAIEKLVVSLHELLEKVNFIQGKEWLQITHFFNASYDENAIVPLLDFHENYYKIGKQIKETNIPAIQAEAELLKKWAKAAGEVILKKYEIDESLILEISDFEQINEELNIQPKPLKGLSLGCFAQMYLEKNELKAVLNGVTLGYGKMTGRFLKLMPKQFVEDLRKFNVELGNKTLMADNVDASFFNANIHPPLLTYEISMPESQNQLLKNRQLNVKDLAIRKVDDEIVLWHLILGESVQVFDLGTQTPKGRSPLYQLLMNFGPNVPDLQYLKEVVESVIPQNGKKMVAFPRVVFENWVLFRKSWIVQDWEMLNKIKHEAALNGVQHLKKVLAEKKIGNKFYIKKKEKLSTKIIQNRKENKPLYVDMDNVILRNIFLKHIKNTHFLFEISEMLPSEDKLIKIKQRPFYTENVLQWYN
jgi:hypothetical protein